jgi:hypothetical protein
VRRSVCESRRIIGRRGEDYFLGECCLMGSGLVVNISWFERHFITFQSWLMQCLLLLTQESNMT